MNTALPALKSAIRRLLLTEWDPIGVGGIVKASDEYDRYADHVVGMLADGADAEGIAQYLREVVSRDMDLPSDVARNRTVAELIVAVERSRASRPSS